ncbi:hypothetical protein [Pseudanabaena sp. UWO310]|uniref:hypothetical protein n=1 Tax=Pseudanabaena sp. UWO310 TaxID=2480795 RepID=UPI001CC1EA68|nr:hypothetical protein [Pseudanabaena sp. UWO310]
MTEEGLKTARGALKKWGSIANFSKFKYLDRKSVTKVLGNTKTPPQPVSAETMKTIGIKLEIPRWQDNWMEFCEAVQDKTLQIHGDFTHSIIKQNDDWEIDKVDCSSTKPLYCQGNGNQNYCSYCSSLITRVQEFVINDQTDVGSWGKNRARYYKFWYSKLENEQAQEALLKDFMSEGSIFGLYQVVRGLVASGIRLNRYDGVGKKVVDFLLDRQRKGGGIGRFVSIAYSKEIHTSFRYTAYGVMSMASIENTPREAIRIGLEFLSRSKLPEDLEDDPAPSAAIAIFLSLHQRAIEENWEDNYLGGHSDYRLQFAAMLNNSNLTKVLEFLGSDKKYIIWKPYAEASRLGFTTALATIEPLVPFCDRPTAWQRFVGTLAYIARFAIDGAIPYNEPPESNNPELDISSKQPDIGISAYFVYLCSTPSIRSKLREHPDGKQILGLADSCFQFVVEASKDLQDRPISSDTLSTVLHMKGCPSNTER